MTDYARYLMHKAERRHYTPRIIKTKAQVKNDKLPPEIDKTKPKTLGKIFWPIGSMKQTKKELPHFLSPNEREANNPTG